MPISSGNSSQNIGSEKESHDFVNERKRKRMQSNRESARRSRMKQHKHLGDHMAQVDCIGKEKSKIFACINITTEKLLDVEAESSIIQIVELRQRMESLDEILNCMNINTNGILENGSFELMCQPGNMASAAEPQYLLATI